MKEKVDIEREEREKGEFLRREGKLQRNMNWGFGRVRLSWCRKGRELKFPAK